MLRRIRVFVLAGAVIFAIGAVGVASADAVVDNFHTTPNGGYHNNQHTNGGGETDHVTVNTQQAQAVFHATGNGDSGHSQFHVTWNNGGGNGSGPSADHSQ